MIALVPRDQMSWQLPATAAAGVTSPGALEAGGTYLLTVSGRSRPAAGSPRTPSARRSLADPVWRRDRSVDVTDPSADNLDVLVDGDDRTFRPVTDPDGDGCDADGHTYRLTVTAGSTRAVNLRVDDPAWGDDTGALTVTAVRVRPAVDTETVAVDTAAPAVATTRNYLAGQQLRITATGTYTYAAGVTADAECSATTADPVWRSTRSTLLVDGHYLGDLTVNGSPPDWRTATGTSSCDPATHSYQLLYTPAQTGPLTLGAGRPRPGRQPRDADRHDRPGRMRTALGLRARDWCSAWS